MPKSQYMVMRLKAFLAAAALCALSACGLVGPEPSRATPGPAATAGELARPRIAERDPGRPRYIRDQWQPRWADADGDGCNTREEVLISESVSPAVVGPGCKILAGEWEDRYTGRRLTSPAEVQVDHLVSLSDGHASGGWAWPPERKVAFANDLEDADELNATWGPQNERKADYGPDRWLPIASFRCDYVAAYARIKARWDLTVTPSQWAAVQRVWAGCGGAG